MRIMCRERGKEKSEPAEKGKICWLRWNIIEVADLGGEAVAGWPGNWRVGGWFRGKELRAERWLQKMENDRERGVGCGSGRRRWRELEMGKRKVLAGSREELVWRREWRRTDQGKGE
ncbi:hypothetical protein POTOM_052289 [Populus tomentosa]|uniref:Uncharacterized protein n=1 Tax=Populus tomentosa TaxID=118781 RepID=A0A8X7YDW8_POPTO|nr:hypothetical protein POTOM_052289 [Populus tomentosa]